MRVCRGPAGLTEITSCQLSCFQPRIGLEKHNVMPDPKKPFSVKFTVPSLAGDKPADGGGPFATFEEVTTAAVAHTPGAVIKPAVSQHRSEERRVGKECRSRWSPY